MTFMIVDVFVVINQYNRKEHRIATPTNELGLTTFPPHDFTTK